VSSTDHDKVQYHRLIHMDNRTWDTAESEGWLSFQQEALGPTKGLLSCYFVVLWFGRVYFVIRKGHVTRTIPLGRHIVLVT